MVVNTPASLSGMKRALIILGVCVLAASIIVSPAGAKKKKTFCQKTGSAKKAKLKAKSKGFYVYLEKGNSTFMVCQDKPKFFGSFGLQAKGDKISQLKVVKKTCAVFVARGGTHNPQVWQFNFSDFKKGNAAQAAINEFGYGRGSAALSGLALSNNCVVAYGGRVNGQPQIVVKGTSAFGYTGQLNAPVGPNITDKELAAVKITGSGATATATWTEAGQPKTYVYTKPAGY